MGTLKVFKVDQGYDVEGTDGAGWLLAVTPAIGGVTVKFDNTVPMTVEDINGQHFNVFYFNDKNIITSIEHPANPGFPVPEIEVDVDSGFWFLTAGISNEKS